MFQSFFSAISASSFSQFRGEERKRKIRLINPNTPAIEEEEKEGKEKGGGIDDSGGCSKVSRKSKWSRIGRFRSISRFVRWYCRQVSRGVARYRVSPCTRTMGPPKPRGKIGTALSSCPRHHPCHPFFAECSKSSGEDVQTRRKQSRRGERATI